jgi:predicted nucleic acid-binding protein
MRLYLDTSVLGALADSDEPQRVEITRRFLGSLAPRALAMIL